MTTASTDEPALFGSDDRAGGGSVYEVMRREIIEGKLLPGVRLRVAELMDRYKSGLNPTREALKRLTGEALVVHSNQRGFSVKPISQEDLEDLTRARVVLVGAAVRRSVEAGGMDWEERVLLAGHRLSKCRRYISLTPLVLDPHYDSLHLEFHLALTSGVNSAWLQDAERRLFFQWERYRNLSVGRVIKHREDEHEQLVDAALSRDAERAGKLAEQHIQTTHEFTLNAIKELDIL